MVFKVTLKALVSAEAEHIITADNYDDACKQALEDAKYGWDITAINKDDIWVKNWEIINE